MRESTDTNRFTLFPEGHYRFAVIGRPEKFKTASGKGTYRKWIFTTFEEGNIKTFKTVMFPWESNELLIALGGVVTGPGVVDWDDEEVDKKEFEADVVHEPDNKGQMRARLKNATSVGRIKKTPDESIPF